MMTGALKLKVAFATGRETLFAWQGPAAGEDDAVERASAAWSGTWRMITGGDYEAPGLGSPVIGPAGAHERHVRWALGRLACDPDRTSHARALDKIEEAARGWSRALLARDPAIRAEDFTARTESRGAATVQINTPMATIARSSQEEIVVGMGYDHAAAAETIDAVMACAMAVAWSKRRSTAFNAVFAAANPLFWEQGSATLRAGSIRDVMRRDAGKARRARNAVSSLGFREIAGAYPWI
mgnify:CR=1 FL=1